MKKRIETQELKGLFNAIHILFANSKFKKSEQYKYFIGFPMYSDFLKLQYVISMMKKEPHNKWLHNQFIISFFYKIMNLIKIFDKKMYHKLRKEPIIDRILVIRSMVFHQEESFEDGFIPVINSNYFSVGDEQKKWMEDDGISFIIDNYTNEDGATEDNSRKPYNGKPIRMRSSRGRGLNNVMLSFNNSIKLIHEKIHEKYRK